jgi:hypothetical protein
MGQEQIARGKELIKSVEKEAMDLYGKISHKSPSSSQSDIASEHANSNPPTKGPHTK